MGTPTDLGLLEASRELTARRLSSRELTEACLRAIEERNGGEPSFDGAPHAINAWVRLYPERALAEADAADARRAREGGEAPLVCGIPLAVKDLYGVKDLPLTASSRVLEGNRAAHDAVAYARLRARGMVLLGHTHTHEFAAGGTTDQVGNPWALERVAGGSSGGSAAALAAGMAPAALGTDTCGSLRIPAACCGISSIKPTHGRVPIDGIIPLAPSLDHAGPMARSVADCSALLEAMAADGPQIDPLSPPPAPLLRLPTAPRPGPRPLAGTTIALTDRVEDLPVEAPVEAALQAAVQACERLGASVVAVPAPGATDWDGLGAILMTETWARHRRYAERHHLYRPAIAEFVESARRFEQAAPYLAAQERRARNAAAWQAWLAAHGVDLVLEPTLPIVPYGRGPGYERGHAGGPGDPMLRLTATWDMTGMPVAALPVSWEAGVSLIGPRGAEAAVAQAAIDLQDHELGRPGISN